MRIPGYTFNNKADASSQVNLLAKKFRCKMWALRELRKAGFSEKELLAVYKSAIRRILEFSSVVYHSLLTKEQSEFLETLQYNVLKNIYSYVYSKRKILELSGVSTLEESCWKVCQESEQPRTL